jgi:hypothetical protein
LAEVTIAVRPKELDEVERVPVDLAVRRAVHPFDRGCDELVVPFGDALRIRPRQSERNGRSPVFRVPLAHLLESREPVFVAAFEIEIDVIKDELPVRLE